MKLSVSAIAFKNDGQWVVQGVEYDIVATAKTREDLPKAFAKAILATLSINRQLGRDGLDGYPSAPEEFKKAFEEAHFGLLPQHHFETPELTINDVRLVAA